MPTNRNLRMILLGLVVVLQSPLFFSPKSPLTIHPVLGYVMCVAGFIIIIAGGIKEFIRARGQF